MQMLATVLCRSITIQLRFYSGSSDVDSLHKTPSWLRWAVGWTTQTDLSAASVSVFFLTAEETYCCLDDYVFQHQPTQSLLFPAQCGTAKLLVQRQQPPPPSGETPTRRRELHPCTFLHGKIISAVLVWQARPPLYCFRGQSESD